MYLCVKQQIKRLSRTEFENLRELCRYAKNLYNVALYNIRQYYFQHGRFLSYEENYHLCKSNENYRQLNSNMAQQIIKEADSAFKSFYGLINLAKEGKYDFKSIRMPRYLKKDSYYNLVIGFVRLNGSELTIPYSNTFRKEHSLIKIKVPPVLSGKKIKEIKVIPKWDARFFEIHYTYKVDGIQRELDHKKALAIDLGVNNLATCATNEGKTFIVDGKRLKAVNQWYNKENSRLQSIKDLQKIKGTTKKQALLSIRRNAAVNDYVNKTCRYVINYCLEFRIGKLVVGYNKDIQKEVNIGRRNNQSFVNIPIGKIKRNLEYLCKLNGILFLEQEESYTSKASFLDGDKIPEYDPSNKIDQQFSGKRIKRGLYRTKSGHLINADVNSALNILKKSNVVSLEALYSSGEVDTPKRIRIA